jgi:hypothetical protein
MRNLPMEYAGNVASGVTSAASAVSGWPRAQVVATAAKSGTDATRAVVSGGITGLGTLFRLTGSGLQQVGVFVEPTTALAAVIPTPGRVARVRSARPGLPSRSVIAAFAVGAALPGVIATCLQVRENYHAGNYDSRIKAARGRLQRKPRDSEV